MHTPREPYAKTYVCELCERPGIPVGTRCACTYRCIQSPGVRGLKDRLEAAQKAREAARALADAPVPPAPMCAWCHQRPPVDTGGMCRQCAGDVR